ncbi:hypothetical protein Tco_0675057 [Tanacetum coccineum]
MKVPVILRGGVSADEISSQLSSWASALFKYLPPFIRIQVYLHYVSAQANNFLLNFLSLNSFLILQLILYLESADSAQLSQKLLANLVDAEHRRNDSRGLYLICMTSPRSSFLWGLSFHEDSLRYLSVCGLSSPKVSILLVLFDEFS